MALVYDENGGYPAQHTAPLVGESTAHKRISDTFRQKHSNLTLHPLFEQLLELSAADDLACHPSSLLF